MAWADSQRQRSGAECYERRDLFPEGVASGDPDSHSVLLWARRPFTSGSHAILHVEISEDEAFNHVVATANSRVVAASDWTCRVLVGKDAPIERFDANGFGDEANNRAAVASLTGYRALRWGRHVDLIITDQRSYRSEAPASRAEANVFASPDYPHLLPQQVLEALDAGRAYAGGKPPESLRFGATEVANFRKAEPPQTILGETQKRWFLRRLADSRATWKIWGCSLGTLEGRVDLQNLPESLAQAWPEPGYACLPNADHSTAWTERAEIYAHLRKAGIAGFVTLSGDRHSFWAGLAAPALPPQPFEPVGVAFITGSIGMPGLAEKLESSLPAKHPLRTLYLADREGASSRR